MTIGQQPRSRQSLFERLHAALGEDLAAAREREKRLVAELDSAPDLAIVLYGAGNLGRRTLELLREHGRDASAFIDNNSELWGTAVDGVPVLAPAEGSSRHAADGLVIVTIWRAEGGHDFLATRDDLRERGWARIESFISLFWGYGSPALPYITIDAPSSVLMARTEITRVAELWSDDRSLQEYVGQVLWRLSGDFAALSTPEADQYFADGVVRVGADEVFVDCGAFTGDTMLDVARRTGSWRAYHAFEPDPESFRALTEAATSLAPYLAQRVELHRAGTADRAGKARFEATGLASAKLSNAGTYEVDLVAIDDVVRHPPPTFIKMDIEGAEASALNGAARSIAERQPLLAISAYHKQADLWQLPRLVHEMRDDYRMYLRPHAGEGFDTVLYAIPSGRRGGAEDS